MHLVLASACSETECQEGWGLKIFVLQTIKWLWEVVHEFDLDEQRHFLKFFTGSDRAPIGGLGNQRCIVQASSPVHLLFLIFA